MNHHALWTAVQSKICDKYNVGPREAQYYIDRLQEEQLTREGIVGLAQTDPAQRCWLAWSSGQINISWTIIYIEFFFFLINHKQKYNIIM